MPCALMPRALQLVERGVDRLLPDVGDDDVAAGAAEDLGLAEAGARSAAGDEGGLALIVHLNNPR